MLKLTTSRAPTFYITASEETFDAELAEYCRASLINDWTSPFDNGLGAAHIGKLSDKEVIAQYFDAPHEESLHGSVANPEQGRGSWRHL